jgi:hypothetical protein
MMVQEKIENKTRISRTAIVSGVERLTISQMLICRSNAVAAGCGNLTPSLNSYHKTARSGVKTKMEKNTILRN